MPAASPPSASTFTETRAWENSSNAYVIASVMSQPWCPFSTWLPASHPCPARRSSASRTTTSAWMRMEWCVVTWCMSPDRTKRRWPFPCAFWKSRPAIAPYATAWIRVRIQAPGYRRMVGVITTKSMQGLGCNDCCAFATRAATRPTPWPRWSMVRCLKPCFGTASC